MTTDGITDKGHLALETGQNDTAVLFSEVAEAAQRLASDASQLELGTRPAPKDIKDALRRGLPLLKLATPKVRPDLFLKSWQTMADLVARHDPEATDDIARLSDALTAAGESVEELVSAVLRNNTEFIWDWAVARDVSPQWLYFIGEFAARPFLRAFAEDMAKDETFQEWTKRYCPVCGRRPNVGVIRSENLKSLHCPGCSTLWPTRRYECGLCGQAGEDGALHFLQVDQWPHWRIEICDRCKGYLKVIDYREMGAWKPGQDLFVEDARTLPLDAVAQEEGYTKPGLEGGVDHQHAV